VKEEMNSPSARTKTISDYNSAREKMRNMLILREE
jgi:hypothetical protein